MVELVRFTLIFALSSVTQISHAQETRVENGIINLGGGEDTQRSRSDYYWEMSCGQIIHEASQEIIGTIHAQNGSGSAGIVFPGERNRQPGVYLFTADSSHFVPLSVMRRSVNSLGETFYHVTVDRQGGPNILVEHSPDMIKNGEPGFLNANEEDADADPDTAPAKSLAESDPNPGSSEPSPDIMDSTEPDRQAGAAPAVPGENGRRDPVGTPNLGYTDNGELIYVPPSDDFASVDYEYPLYRSEPIDDHQTQNALLATLGRGLTSTTEVYQGIMRLLAERRAQLNADPSMSDWMIGRLEIDLLQYPSKVRNALCHCEKLHQLRPTITEVREHETFEDVKDQLNCGEFS